MKTMKSGSYQVTFYLSSEIDREIGRQAKKAKLSRSQYLSKLVRDFVAKTKAREAPE